MKNECSTLVHDTEEFRVEGRDKLTHIISQDASISLVVLKTHHALVHELHPLALVRTEPLGQHRRHKGRLLRIRLGRGREQFRHGLVHPVFVGPGDGHPARCIRCIEAGREEVA